MKTVLRCTAAALLLLLAACSGGSGGSATPAATTSMSDADLLTLGKQLTQCYRDNGVTDMPDPYVEKGRLKLPESSSKKIDQKYPQQQLDQVKQACREIAGKLPAGALDTGSDDEQRAAGPGDVEMMRRYAQCMRDNGVPEWPDPKADGSFGLKGTALAKEGPSQRIKNASGKCQQYWSGGVAVS
jgi:hypothetical protein